MDAQRVVVIQDASREVSSSAVRWALQGLSLKPGDMLTLLSVLHQVYTPSKSLYAGSKKLLGYKSRIDSNSMFDVNEKIIEREVAKKKEEYAKNAQLVQISELYEKEKVKFSVQIATGPSPKVVALKAAISLEPTWVILDRQMKKNRKYFLEKLSCGISRMKKNNIVEQLRGPRTDRTNVSSTEQDRSCQVTYDDMLPGSPDDLFSIEMRPRVDKENLPAQEITKQSSNTEEAREEWQLEDILQHSICSLCKNTRPNRIWQRNFTYTELHTATDGFSPRNYLSEGGKGYIFRGQLKCNNLKIIVKQHQNIIPEGEMDLQSKVNILKKARHKNVLMLLGSCTEESLKLLVYEYACNGSVNQHLSKHCPLPLTWTERMKVALGTARGLNYLHENDIVHKNLRTSNIVLTHDFEPLLGDFGFSAEHDEVLETLGHIPPEYSGNWKLSTALDVYAFGVILLELITGRMVTDKIRGGKGLVGWARPLLKERKLLEIVDPRIGNSYDAEQLYWMGRIIHNCLNKVPNKRLTMDKVVCALECVADRRAQDLMEDVSAVRSYLVRRSSNMNGQRSCKKPFEQESFRGLHVENQVSRSFSLSFSTRTSTSFSRSSVSSGTSDKLQREKAGRISVYYAEMHS
ncbi:hypothetical protein JCGZ_11079 [Jatropha curcas]|uniref:Protein kinase domain-containing protein n=1 Tax=Jatropha curcas TaxID=180498 RepID=A0A067KRS3_JATCU|nr:hypothetical protein JCGZ_11079 [Jatropha curcas]